MEQEMASCKRWLVTTQAHYLLVVKLAPAPQAAATPSGCTDQNKMISCQLSSKTDQFLTQREADVITHAKELAKADQSIIRPNVVLLHPEIIITAVGSLNTLSRMSPRCVHFMLPSTTGSIKKIRY